jgi:hypothetical protein
MRLISSLVLCLTLICTGCVCMFVPCDRGVHVSGHVLDAQHRLISHATVEFYGVKKETAADGCSGSAETWQLLDSRSRSRSQHTRLIVRAKNSIITTLM